MATCIGNNLTQQKLINFQLIVVEKLYNDKIMFHRDFVCLLFSIWECISCYNSQNHIRQQVLLSWPTEPPHDKTNKMTLRPVKTQINLASTQSDQSSLCAQWVAKDPTFLHADSKDSDQTGQMPRLIWVFAEHTVILLVLSWGGSTQNLSFRTDGLSRFDEDCWV